MILGSLVAAGAPLAEIEKRLRALPLDGFTLRETRVERHGFEEETSWADEYRRILKLFETRVRNR